MRIMDIENCMTTNKVLIDCFPFNLYEFVKRSTGLNDDSTNAGYIPERNPVVIIKQKIKNIKPGSVKSMAR